MGPKHTVQCVETGGKRKKGEFTRKRGKENEEPSLNTYSGRPRPNSAPSTGSSRSLLRREKRREKKLGENIIMGGCDCVQECIGHYVSNYEILQAHFFTPARVKNDRLIEFLARLRSIFFLQNTAESLSVCVTTPLSHFLCMFAWFFHQDNIRWRNNWSWTMPSTQLRERYVKDTSKIRERCEALPSNSPMNTLGILVMKLLTVRTGTPVCSFCMCSTIFSICKTDNQIHHTETNSDRHKKSTWRTSFPRLLSSQSARKNWVGMGKVNSVGLSLV